MYQSGRQSETYAKILRNAQSGEDHLDKMFHYLNGNIIHLEFAIDNIEQDEIMRFKYECEFFNSYVLKNLEVLLKLSKKKNPIFFEIGKKLWDRVNQILNTLEFGTSGGEQFQFFKELKRSMSFLLLDHSPKKNWYDYDKIVNRSLFYWAKIGDMEKFV